MPSETYPLELSVSEAHQLIQTAPERVQLIDVREEDEREICLIEGARHIPMQEIPAQFDLLPRDRHLLIHCHHGSRSLQVTRFLRAKGFLAVSNVAGGIEAWTEQIDSSLRRY